ncbi:hypothetical protein PTI45_03068 [Paenibacillus nuruki]|uniref:Uncharacterized protein n=1 Tax=Paenibacillus nuruki TaxID=1886670 RepID=A0A1E3L198_9BACL|nr:MULTISPECIES: hypothetical protein [Paenibacillus]ODP27506.1 hypothetical protein PTI45_03068 [Paenibacillus nuruki]
MNKYEREHLFYLSDHLTDITNGALVSKIPDVNQELSDKETKEFIAKKKEMKSASK